MKKIIIVIAMILVAVQAWGEENAYKVKMNRVKLDFLACAREYDLSKLRGSIDQAFSIADNRNNSKKLDECEAKIETYIRQAANGDNAVNDGLMNIIHYMSTDESKNRIIFAQKYAHKLQAAKESTTKKATGASRYKGVDGEKTDHKKPSASEVKRLDNP